MSLRLLACLLALAAAGSAAAAPAPSLRRDVLALYDSTRETEPRVTRLHRFVELPLNHFGYRLTYWDVSRGMPDQRLTDSAAAVLSWFDKPVAAEGYARWCAELARADGLRPKRILFGSPGVALDGPADAERGDCLANAGIRLAGQRVRLGMFSRVAAADPAMFRKGDDLLPPAGIYPAIVAADGAQSRLGIAPADGAPAAVDLVVIGPSGAYVGDAAALVEDPRLPNPLWRLDIFAFLRTVLPDEPHPVPDVTTALGRRLFFATVDPDGWLSRLPAIHYGEPPVLASEMLVPMLRDDFSDLPVSVAVIADDFSQSLAGRDAGAGRAAAAALFSLPQVEIASAGTSGVSDWAFFSNFDPAREAAALSATREAGVDDARGLVPSVIRSLGTAFMSDRARMASAAVALPRKYAAEPFSVDGEIGGGLVSAAAIAPPGRSAGLFFWSGDGAPFAEALSAPDVPSIGGGGGAAPPEEPGVSGLWPFSAQVGDFRQVYNALSGPQAYGVGDETPWAFHALLRTLDATDAPRRLKPFQLAFSAGDMVRFGSRQAIRRMLLHARESEVLPVRASDYVRIVEGFQTAEITALGSLLWRIDGRGALATVRFDDASALALDLDASRGVLGARRKGGRLYVALDPADTSPLVALTPSTVPSGIVSATGQLGIASARWWISQMHRDGCSARFTAAGFGPGRIEMTASAGLAPAITMADAKAPDRPIFSATLSPNSEGRFAVVLPALGGETADVAVSGLCGS